MQLAKRYVINVFLSAVNCGSNLICKNLIGLDYIHNGSYEIDCEDKKIGPEGSKIDPPGDLQSLLHEGVLLALLHSPPGWTYGVAGQHEGLAVGQEGHEDGVDGGKDEGGGAAAKQGGHHGGLGDVGGDSGEDEKGYKM